MISSLPANSPPASSVPPGQALARPKLGFAGVGWIGRHRMEAILSSGLAQAAAIAEPSPDMAGQALNTAGKATWVKHFGELLDLDLEGVVIATPSALHAQQANAALQRGMAVFCQKPLGRTGAETRQVIQTARAANRLLGVDLSYRYVAEVLAVRDLVRSGELGRIYAVDLVFHNAYGPDKAWFYDWRLSGGGCVIDLGIHLVDLVLWTLGFPAVNKVESRLFAEGRPILGPCQQVEDYAVAHLDLEGDVAVRLACSWKLSAGCDAVIGASFHGTKGGAAFNNVNGSFYRFVAERYHGTKRDLVACTDEEWGGKGAVDWARRLVQSRNFDPQIEHLVTVADTLDRIYRLA